MTHSRSPHRPTQPNWEVVDTRNKSYIYFINPCATLSPVASLPVLQPLLNSCLNVTASGAPSTCQVLTPPATSSLFPKYLGSVVNIQQHDIFFEMSLISGYNNAPNSCHSSFQRSTAIRFYCGSSIVRHVILCYLCLLIAPRAPLF